MGSTTDTCARCGAILTINSNDDGDATLCDACRSEQFRRAHPDLAGLRVSHTCPCCGQPTAEPVSEFVPLSEVRARLGIGRQTCYRSIRAGTIPGFTLGNMYRVPRPAFEAFIRGQELPKPDPSPKTIPYLRRVDGDRLG